MWKVILSSQPSLMLLPHLYKSSAVELISDQLNACHAFYLNWVLKSLEQPFLILHGFLQSFSHLSQYQVHFFKTLHTLCFWNTDLSTAVNLWCFNYSICSLLYLNVQWAEKHKQLQIYCKIRLLCVSLSTSCLATGWGIDDWVWWIYSKL